MLQRIQLKFIMSTSRSVWQIGEKSIIYYAKICQPSLQMQKALKANALKASLFYWLPDQDSNLDNQIQKLMYYHYTIGQ